MQDELWRLFEDTYPVQEKTGTNYRGAAFRKWAGDPILFLFLSRQYHYLPIVQINPFRPSPSHCATDSFSDLV
jgi:hypothetical protein